LNEILNDLKEAT
jgi:hypothetical protein